MRKTTYATCTWSPHTKTDIQKVEVQRFTALPPVISHCSCQSYLQSYGNVCVSLTFSPMAMFMSVLLSVLWHYSCQFYIQSYSIVRVSLTFSPMTLVVSVLPSALRHCSCQSYLQSYHIVGPKELLLDVKQEVGFSVEHTPQTGLLHLQVQLHHHQCRQLSAQ